MADAGGVRVAGKRVQDQDGVGLGGVQRAVGLVGHLDRRQRGAAIEGDGIEPYGVGLDDHAGRIS